MKQQFLAVIGLAICLASSNMNASAAASETAASGANLTPQAQNIARGKPYTFSVPPNYGPCTDSGDATDLTDGIRSGRTPESGYWTEKSTVGWNHVRQPIAITLDLGRSEPISGAAFHSGAGGAGVSLPSSVAVLVSDDGKTFRLAGDLAVLAERPWPPDYGTFATYSFESHALRTAGRYVRFVIVPSSIFAFVDEIEVFSGGGDATAAAAAGPSQSPALGKPISDEQLAAPLRLTQLRCYRRIATDIQHLESVVRSTAQRDAQQPLLEELKAIRGALQSRGTAFPQKLEGFRAVAPLDNLHRRVLAVFGKLLESRRTPPLTLWHTPRYQLLDLFVTPPPPAPVSLSVSAMPGEWRAEVINLTNATAQQKQVRLSIDGLPGGTNPSFVSVFEVEYVDTREGKWIASALRRLNPQGSSYATAIPAGMTRQIWLSINPAGVAAGAYQGQIQVQGDGFHEQVPLRLEVSPVRFPDQLACSLGMWDYAADDGYQIDNENKAAAIKDMLDHRVDTAWCSNGSVPLPKPADFDAHGNLTGKIDYSRWDAFIKLWGGRARYYAGFSGIQPDASFAGHAEGTPEFDRAVGAWAADWAKHNKQLGLKPGQAMILFMDEPAAAAHFKTTLAFAKPFRAATDEIHVFCDPVGTATMQVENAPQALEACDVISPPELQYLQGGKPLQDFYAQLREKGKRLTFYNCSGPTRQFDPAYFRFQPWHALAAGASGVAFWAYGDAGGTNSWNEYTAVGSGSFTPVYLAPDSVTTSKHWEAAREGLEDYQYVVLLRERGAAGSRDVAAQLPAQVVANLNKRFGTDYESGWRNPSSLAEAARLRVFRLLSSAKP